MTRSFLAGALATLLLLCVLKLNAVLAQDDGNIDFLGAIPGHLEEVEIDGDYAFGVARCGLLVLDVSNVPQPTQVTFLPLRYVGGIALKGDYAYVAGVSLLVVDISEPASPVVVGSCHAPGDHVAVEGTHAYVTDSGDGLRVIDISQPTAPRQVGIFEVETPLSDLDLVQNLVYLADKYEGLRIIDVSDPSAPKEVGRYDPSYYVDAVDVEGHYATIASPPGVRIIDVLDPAAPVEVGLYDTDQSVKSVTVEGGYAYLTHWDTITVLDIHDPSSPVQVGATEIFGRPQAVTIVNSTAYVAGGFGGLRILDVVNPSAPTELGHYGLLGDVWSVEVDHDGLYVTGGFYYSGEFNFDQGDAEDDAIPSWPYAGLFVLDMSHPALPRILGYRSFGNAMDVKVRDHLAYVTDYMGRFGILDISDPAAPWIIGHAYTDYRTIDLALEGHHAYPMNEEYDVRIFDVSKPSLPTELGNISIGSSDIEVSGAYAFVTSYYTGLDIIDVSEPSKPHVVGTFDPPNWAEGLDVAGKLVYLANGILGLRIIDVTDPTAPVQVGICDTPGYALNVVVEGEYAYVADRDMGVRVIDIGDPSAPEEIAFFLTSGDASHIAVLGDRIAVGMSDGGMALLQGRFPSGVDDDDRVPAVAAAGALQQNYPNPFNPRTAIHFAIRGEAAARLSVLSVDGREVAILVDRRLPAGPHVVTWTGRGDQGQWMPSGVYLYRLQVGEYSDTKRMLLVR